MSRFFRGPLIPYSKFVFELNAGASTSNGKLFVEFLSQYKTQQRAQVPASVTTAPGIQVTISAQPLLEVQYGSTIEAAEPAGSVLRFRYGGEDNNSSNNSSWDGAVRTVSTKTWHLFNWAEFAFTYTRARL